MAELPPLRQRVDQLREQLAHDCRCQQALAGSWESDEACLFAVLRLAIDCRAGGDPATSLELLAWLRQQGVEHPLVVENQIRGLIDADRFVEATLLLPALAELDQGEMLQGATEALLIHQQNLLVNLRHHCPDGLYEPDLVGQLDTIPLQGCVQALLACLQRLVAAEGDELALVLLQELTQWGHWSPDVLPLDMQYSWSRLVLRLGEGVWCDLDVYRDALQRLDHCDDPEIAWDRLRVDLILQCDLGEDAEAFEAALAFLIKNPGHPGALAWLSEQQGGKLRTGLPGASAYRVLAVDQALDRDECILDYLRKLVDPNSRNWVS